MVNTPSKFVRSRVKVLLFALEPNPVIAQLLQEACTNIGLIHVLSPRELLVLHPVRQSHKIPVFIFDQGTLHIPVRPYLRAASALFPAAKSIVVDENFPVQLAFSLLCDHAHGFIQYRELKPKLSRAVHTVAEGHLWMQTRLLEQLCLYFQSTNVLKLNGSGDLTPRQKTIAELVIHHFSNKQIACELSISENTVKFHLAKVFTKLGINDRRALADIALRTKTSRNLAPMSHTMSMDHDDSLREDGVSSGSHPIRKSEQHSVREV